MKIYNLGEFIRLPYAVVTSGTFDGVHLGHQKILSRLKEIAVKNSGETVVITYWPHPRIVLSPSDHSISLLNTFEEKAALLEAEGVQHLLKIDFTREFSQLTSNEFISDILVNTIGTKKLVIGYDHRFGKNREGSFEQLKLHGPTYGFDVEEIPQQDIHNIAISSSQIRKSLEQGDLENAKRLLGRDYMLTGKVVKGEKLGRVLGFPTANLEVGSDHKLIPAEGIYAVTVRHAGADYGGMLYIGKRPTLNGSRRSIEVNIFNFNRDIYDEEVTLTVRKLLRLDTKFNNLEELKIQLSKDRESALSVLQHIS